MRLRYTRRAKENLSDIRDYIAQDNPQAARRMINAVRIQAQGLMRQPNLGRPGRVEGTRELVIHRYPYILVYRVSSDAVDVLSIYHDARAWPASFD